MTEIQNSKQKTGAENVWSLGFEVWDLFVIWCLEFAICGVRLFNSAGLSGFGF